VEFVRNKKIYKGKIQFIYERNFDIIILTSVYKKTMEIEICGVSEREMGKEMRRRRE
jgi:hypothetical protein